MRPRGAHARCSARRPAAAAADTCSTTCRPRRVEPPSGSRVQVPFGRGKCVGIVVAVAVDIAAGPGAAEAVLRVLDDAPLLDAELMQTVNWAADYWLGAPGEAYANALPLALREARPLPAIGAEYWHVTAAGRAALEARQTSRCQQDAAVTAGRRVRSARRSCNERLPGWRAAARRLAAVGLVERSEQPLQARNPVNTACAATESGTDGGGRRGGRHAGQATSRSCSTASPAAARPRSTWR